MAQVVIRNIDDGVMERLRARAAAEKKSLEQTLREILAAAAQSTRAERVEEMRRIRAMSPPLASGMPLAQDLVREDRDGR